MRSLAVSLGLVLAASGNAAPVEAATPVRTVQLALTVGIDITVPASVNLGAPSSAACWSGSWARWRCATSAGR
ncbi:hypothetical protein [Micromonospora tarensis]|uniref:Uncharacterized protein n=1 Tax=Micromonospora tarensis TaxID=2806100 RepID=A0ABS1YE16_9ACTN|nr:hypothetical protein [Micromonospora tarensis]MBM0275655.1 hypothetical protein [Micromonospora tarensis]